MPWTQQKFDLLSEKRKLQEAKEQEKQMGLNYLLMQQEHNFEKAFLLKKELERMNREKESILEKKKAVYGSMLTQAVPERRARRRNPAKGPDFKAVSE